MQILRTECSFSVDHNGQTMHVVKFIAEGGETIEVKLAASPGEMIFDAKLVARAKAIMAQAASFSSDLHNGDGSRRGTSQTSEDLGSGRLFRFVYRDDEGVKEIPNINLPSLEAARADALRSAAELLAEARLKRQEPQGWAVRVYDVDGQLVVNVDFDEVQDKLSPEDSL